MITYTLPLKEEFHTFLKSLENKLSDEIKELRGQQLEKVVKRILKRHNKWWIPKAWHISPSNTSSNNLAVFEGYKEWYDDMWLNTLNQHWVFETERILGELNTFLSTNEEFHTHNVSAVDISSRLQDRINFEINNDHLKE